MKFPQNAQFCTGHFLKKIKTKIVVTLGIFAFAAQAWDQIRVWDNSPATCWRDGGHFISALHVWFRFYVPFFFLLTTFTVVD